MGVCWHVIASTEVLVLQLGELSGPAGTHMSASYLL